MPFQIPRFTTFGALGALALLAACGPGMEVDLDLRDQLGAGFDTTPALAGGAAGRPVADDRGVISYPSYDVAIARRNDTVASLAARVGVDADALARSNGRPTNAILRPGEIIPLPQRAATTPMVAAEAPVPSKVAASALAAPAVQSRSLESRASQAIDRAAPAPASTAPDEPGRHRVKRGETIYTVARANDLPVRTLAQWNGLEDDARLREGQVLLIPAAAPAPQASQTRPGEGTPAPLPPSAAKPLPGENLTQETPKETPPSQAMADQTTAASDSGARLAYPVKGTVVRAYAKGRNDGIDIAASAGTPVRAAGDGTVAAITRDTDDVPILVLRHADNVLTVYAGVEDVTVEKGDAITRGQQVAKVRAGDPAVLHFEVREGFESVDPARYLD